jgi:hypothetical protein
MNLDNNDYVEILNYYKVRVPKSKRLIQSTAEKLLSSKLCKCIKKVNTNNKNEPRAIGICTKTIFNNKGLTRGKFRCKNKRYVNFNKTKKNRK